MIPSFSSHLVTIWTSILLMIFCMKAVQQISAMEMPVPTTTIPAPPHPQPVMDYYQYSITHEQNAQEQQQQSAQRPQAQISQSYRNSPMINMQEEKHIMMQHPYEEDPFNYTQAGLGDYSFSHEGQSNESAEIIYSQPLIMPDDFSPITNFPVQPTEIPLAATATTTTEAPKVYYYTNPYINNTIASKVLASGQYENHILGDKKTIVVTSSANEDSNKPSSSPAPPTSPPKNYPEAPIFYGRPDTSYREFNVQASFSVPKNTPKPEWNMTTKKPSHSSDENKSQNAPSPWKPMVGMPPSKPNLNRPSLNRRPNVPHDYIKMKAKGNKQVQAVRTALNFAKSRQRWPPGPFPFKFHFPNMNSFKKDGSESSMSVSFMAQKEHGNQRPAAILSKPRKPKPVDYHSAATANEGAVHRPFPVPRFVPVPQLIEIVEPVPRYYTVYKQVYVTKEIPVPKFIPFIIPIPIPKKKIVTKHKTVAVPKPQIVQVPYHIPKPVLVPIHKPIPVPIFKPVEVEVPVIKEELVYVKKPYPVFVDAHGNVIGSHLPTSAEAEVNNSQETLKEGESAKRPQFSSPSQPRQVPRKLSGRAPRRFRPPNSRSNRNMGQRKYFPNNKRQDG